MVILGILSALGSVLLPATAFGEVVKDTIAAGSLINEALEKGITANNKKAIEAVIKLEHRGEGRLKNIALVAARFKKKPPFKGFTFDFEAYARSLQKRLEE